MTYTSSLVVAKIVPSKSAYETVKTRPIFRDISVLRYCSRISLKE